MNMPEEYTVPQAASYLNVSEEDGSPEHQVQAPESLAPWDPVVHPAGCPCGLRQQLRSEDRPNTTVALDEMGRCIRRQLPGAPAR